jgi:hypothetical protein
MKDDQNPGYKLHQCDFLPKQGVQVISAKGYIPGRDKTWCLYIFREATESDLENNHYLEEEGDLIWTTAIEISHCPYCGRSLFENMKERDVDFGKFTHTDFSGSKSKMQ